MIKKAKNSLEGVSCFDTTKYIKMAKRIKEEHENSSEEPDFVLKHVSNKNPVTVKHLFSNIMNYI